jgi:hypothetical protein
VPTLAAGATYTYNLIGGEGEALVEGSVIAFSCRSETLIYRKCFDAEDAKRYHTSAPTSVAPPTTAATVCAVVDEDPLPVDPDGGPEWPLAEMFSSEFLDYAFEGINDVYEFDYGCSSVQWCGETTCPCSICDGGDDMYDTGNMLSLDSATTYVPGSDYISGDCIPGNPNPGWLSYTTFPYMAEIDGGSYFAGGIPGDLSTDRARVFVADIHLDGITRFNVKGNLGADGGGEMHYRCLTDGPCSGGAPCECTDASTSCVCQAGKERLQRPLHQSSYQCPVRLAS